MVRVNVYAARTWGAMGNYLAAQHLASVIGTHPALRVSVHGTEELVEWIAQSGRRIKDIALESSDPTELHAAYRGFAALAARTLPRGFETSGGVAPIDLSGLTTHLELTRPEIVVATKGVISRLLTWAVRKLRMTTSVWHYVTNPGLFEMPMHLAPHADVTTVPFAWNVARYRQLTRRDEARVVATGPLLAARSMPAVTTHSVPSRPVIMCFNNRGGRIFTEVMLDLARDAASAEVVYLAVDQPEALAGVRGPFRRKGWQMYDQLPQREYLTLLSRAGAAPGSFLVCKASPATVYEAVYQGIPLLAIPSGLPQEDWVPDLIREHGLGRVVGSSSEAIEATRSWREPEATAGFRAAATRFRRMHLQQDQAEGRVFAVAQSLIESGGESS